MLTDIEKELNEAIRAFRRAADELDWDHEHDAAVTLADVAEAAVKAVRASLVEEDTCAVGDVDPTPQRLRLGICSARREGTEFVCTRYRKHAGRQHVAGDGKRVVAVWPWEVPA